MNQTIRKQGGKSAARSRGDRVFRRSLTPTLALLAAMALGLTAPTTAEAQYQNFSISGGGGGGGGGSQDTTTGGAGGSGGGIGNSGSQGSTSGPGTGGNGQGGGWSDPTNNGYNTTVGAGTEATDQHGGRGGNTVHNATFDVIYRDVTITGGTGGDGGAGGSENNAGSGGSGGSATFNGNAGVTTTITKDLMVRGGESIMITGGLFGAGGSAVLNHQGTVLFNGLTNATHNLTFNGAGGLVRVYINNLQIDGTTANLNLTGFTAYDSARFNTLSLTNGGIFNAGSSDDWGQPGGYYFNNLYIQGTNNELNLDSASIYAYKPANVNGGLYFMLPTDVVATTNPMLTVGSINGGASGLNLAGFNPDSLQIVSNGTGYYTNLREGQTITLVDNIDDPTGVFTGGVKTIVYKGGLRFEDFHLITTAAANGDLTATFGGKSQSVRTGEAFSPYFQGHMAALYAVSGGSRPVLEQATQVLVDTPTSVGEPLISLTAIGSETTLNTGSSVDVESFGGVLAVGTKLNNNAGLTTVAAFGEFGTGSYDTYKHISDLATFNNGRFIGSGDTDYFGGGVFIHHLFDPTHFAGGFSLEGSFRVGTVKNDFNLDMLDRSGYDISRRYWGGHLGLGYNYLLTNMNSVDMFGQLHLAHVENGTFRTTANERLHFLSAKSTVSRLGARYNHNFNELFKGYATAAWDYEFEGDTGGSVDRTRIRRAPNIEGSSGFGQLGLNVRSAANPVSLDLSVFGTAGQQEGYGGTIGLKLDF